MGGGWASSSVPPTMIEPHILHAALDESITSGRFIDTKFYVFSRKNQNGRVGTPKALFANSRVLTVVPYFQTLFSDGFSEGELKDLRDGFPSCGPPYTDSYEYLCDSDLDEEECASTDEPANVDTVPNNFDKVVPGQKCIQPTGPSPQTSDRGDVENAAACDPDTRLAATDVQWGKVAVIKDVAATTFEALLYYMYTGEIDFAPFCSEGEGDHHVWAERRWEMGGRPKVSPKSIYRLADKYDIPELKQLAWDKILEGLDSCDSVEEIFSDFAFFFPQVQEVQTKRLVHILLTSEDPVSEGIIKRLQEKLLSLSGTRLEHSAEALGTLWEELSKSTKATIKEELSSSSTERTLPKVMDSVKAALLHSIHTGSFIDCQFFAKYLGGCKGSIRPIYLSSIAAGEQLNLIQGAPCSTTERTNIDCGHETDTDLEDEGDADRLQSTEDSSEISDLGVGNRGLTPSFLHTGAWRTWRSLFSYLYTGEIAFSPLRSEKVPLNLPLSCSPKSMYSLAKFISLDELVVLAYEHIKQGVSASNVVAELFSSFTASDDNILEMESDLLLGDFECKQTFDEVQGHIRAMSCGKRDFRAKTLGLAYQKLLVKKRRAIREPDFYLLFCARSLNLHAYAVAQLIEHLYCPVCHEYGKNGKGEYGRPFMRCSKCNALRDTVNLECGRCHSLFKHSN